MPTSPVILPCIQPDWPAPNSIHALTTTRQGGVSLPPYDSLNTGDHVGDDWQNVQENRHRIQTLLHLPGSPKWLNQVHGCQVVSANDVSCEADACYSDKAGEVCCVMTADCLPVLLTTVVGDEIAAAHAGWRGLADGVLEKTLEKMQSSASSVLVWLGPCIGPAAFEVGPEVREAFVRRNPSTACAFKASAGDRYLADLYELARLKLEQAGVNRQQIFGGEFCTYTDSARFFSYRRDGVTGRMANLIWIADS